ncbi:MAG: hypothetical protein RR550_05450, partial [Rikenellaceae bacterium]
MLMLLLLSPSVASAQEQNEKYDRRVNKYKQKWERLIPTYTKIQFAGNMGLLSIGTGWDYGKKNQWETDLMFGYLPKFSSDRAKITMTIKENYMPWNLRLSKNFTVEPLASGLYLNTVLGHDFWVKEPDRYPKSYYGFSTKIRIHLYLGQRITYHIAPKYRVTSKSITFFYELSTCDMFLISAVTNHYLRPYDYLSLSF